MGDACVPLPLKLIAAVDRAARHLAGRHLNDIPVLGALDDGGPPTLLCVWFVSQASRGNSRNLSRVAAQGASSRLQSGRLSG